MWQDIVHQQGCAVGHSSHPTAVAKAATLATERQKSLSMARLTLDPQKTMLKPAALQIPIKFPANESGQVFALAGQFGLELRPVFLDDVIE